MPFTKPVPTNDESGMNTYEPCPTLAMSTSNFESTCNQMPIVSSSCNEVSNGVIYLVAEAECME